MPLLRLPLVALAIAVLLTAIFHAAYPDVALTPGLYLLFTLCALALAGLAHVVWNRVRAHPTHAAAQPPGETKP